MKKCRWANHYMAVRPPMCKPVCDACREKWEARTARPPEVASNFAILDVKIGRAALAKLIKARDGHFHATIAGDIVDVHSHNDGVSIEFSVEVNEVALGIATARKPWPYEVKRKVNMRKALDMLDPPPFLRRAVEREIEKIPDENLS